MIDYWLMDGRAHYDIDSALVLETCSSLKEAQQNINEYGADTCIVKVKSHPIKGNKFQVDKQEVVDSLIWRPKEIDHANNK